MRHQGPHTYDRRRKELLAAAEGKGYADQAALGFELRDAVRLHQMPDKVVAVERSLLLAREYLKSRNFKLPAKVTAYIVTRESLAKTGKLEGYQTNPVFGSPFMVMLADADEGRNNNTAMHELLHVVQSHYVWYDRKSSIAASEASAMLLEREALPYYAAAKKPLATDGQILAQFLVYRHGLDGPTSDETLRQRHGYGLSIFLEYLRDNYYSGDKLAFHKEFLAKWASYWSNKQHNALVWAAGGSAEKLARAYKEFARTQVLVGPAEPKDGGRGTTPFGQKYGSASPYYDNPYTNHSKEFGLAAPIIDLGADAYHEISDSHIPPWSIAMFKLLPPARSNAKLVMRVPGEWLVSGPGRVVYYKENGEATSPTQLGANAPRKATDEVVAEVELAGPAYFYAVDTGQTGSGWVKEFKPARLYALEPPSNVETEVQSNRIKVTWTPPALYQSKPELLEEYRFYLNDKAEYYVEMPAGEEAGAARVRMTTVDADAPHLESLKSIEEGPGEYEVTHGPLPSFCRVEALRPNPIIELRVPSVLLLRLDCDKDVATFDFEGNAVPCISAGVYVSVRLLTGVPDLEKLKQTKRPDDEGSFWPINDAAVPATVAGLAGWKSEAVDSRPEESGTRSSNSHHYLVQTPEKQYMWVRIQAYSHRMTVFPDCPAGPSLPGLRAEMMVRGESIARGLSIRRK